jgi:hypothetical protein
MLDYSAQYKYYHYEHVYRGAAVYYPANISTIMLIKIVHTYVLNATQLQ